MLPDSATPRKRFNGQHIISSISRLTQTYPVPPFLCAVWAKDVDWGGEQVQQVLAALRGQDD